MLALMLASIVMASAPRLINYQGRLTDASDNPVTDGMYTVQFSIYHQPEGNPPSLQWSETQSVTTANGFFSVMLGSVNPMAPDIFQDTSSYLGIKVGSDPELTPLTRITSVPYAYYAPYGSGWRHEGSNVYIENPGSKVGIGLLSPEVALHVIGESADNPVARFEGEKLGIRSAVSGSTPLIMTPLELTSLNQDVYGESMALYGYATGAGRTTGADLHAMDGSTSNTGAKIEADGPALINTGVKVTATGGEVNLGVEAVASGLSTADFTGVKATATNYGAGSSYGISSTANGQAYNKGVFGEALDGFQNEGLSGHASSAGTNFGVMAVADGYGDNIGIYALASGGVTNTAGLFRKGFSGVVAPAANSVVIMDNSVNSYLSILGPNIYEKGILFGQPSNEAAGGIIYNAGSVPDGLAFRTLNNSTKMVITSGGDVGIGTASPTARLQVNGNICYTGTIGACSDSRYKKDVANLNKSLDKVLKMRGITYKWKQDEFPDRVFDDKRHVGLIAQEVEELFPEMVMTDAAGYKSVDYGRLTPVLVEAIKEQQKQIDELRTMINQLAHNSKTQPGGPIGSK